MVSCADGSDSVTPRFPTYSDEDLLKILDDKDSENTRKAGSEEADSDSASEPVDRELVDVNKEDGRAHGHAHGAVKPIDWTVLDKNYII